MAQLTVQERLIRIQAEQNEIRKAEHPTLQAVENALLDPSVNSLLTSLDAAASELATPDNEALRLAARNVAESIRVARTVATRQRQLNEQAMAAVGG